MSNNVDYSMMGESPDALPRLVESANDVLTGWGFRPVSGPSGVIRWTDQSGAEHASDDIPGMINGFSRAGGGLRYDRPPSSIFLSAHADTGIVRLTDVLESTGDILERGCGDVAAWAMLAVCESVRAVYGWSTDEYLLETALCQEGRDELWDPRPDHVRARRPPEFLFWLNYFDDRYYTRTKDLLPSDAIVTKLAGGVLVHFDVRSGGMRIHALRATEYERIVRWDPGSPGSPHPG